MSKNEHEEKFREKFKAELKGVAETKKAYDDACRSLEDAIQPTIADIKSKGDNFAMRGLALAMWPDTTLWAILMDTSSHEMGDSE